MRNNMKKIYKYATGDVIPEGAIYLGTITQTERLTHSQVWEKCWLVWHYFAVESKDEKLSDK